MLDNPAVYYEDNYYRDKQELIDYLLDVDDAEFDEQFSSLSNKVIAYTECQPIFLADCLPKPESLKKALECERHLDAQDLIANSIYDLTYLLDEDWDSEVKGLSIFEAYCSVIEAVWLWTGIFLYPLAWLSLKIIGAINKHLYVWDSVTGKDAFLPLDELVELREKYRG